MLNCRLLIGVLALVLAGGTPRAQPPSSATVIRNVLVLDGTGSAPRQVDVRIEGDRIAAVGPLTPAA